VNIFQKKKKGQHFTLKRIEWEKIQELAVEGPEEFLKMYRMEYGTLMKLCDIMHPKIMVNDEMAKVRTGKDAITVEIILHRLLWWLSDGSYLDIILSAGISLAKFYSCVYKCINAIIESEDLPYKFPSTEKELDEAAQCFESLSTQAAIKVCVACIDGYLLLIKVPSSNEMAMSRRTFQDIIKPAG